MTYLTITDQAAVHIIHARVQYHLWDERQRRGNDRWFTVEEIADMFGKRPPLIPLILALKDLAASGSVEGDHEGRVRHLRGDHA
jgi:hypothetical protein